MAYNFIKYLHILLAGLAFGNRFYLMLLRNHSNYHKLFNITYLISFILLILTGMGLMHIAGFSIEDDWILYTIIILPVLALSLYANFRKNYNLQLLIIEFILLNAVLLLMVSKIES